MSIVPTTDIGRITFYEAHVPAWSVLPTQLGLLPSDCAALAALVAASRAAYNQQQIALEAARAATLTMRQNVHAMHALGAADIAKIKAYADATHNTSVFPLALIPEPATPSPVGPPGTPTSFIVALSQGGAVTLKWKCGNPVGTTGTIYEVRRRIGDGAFEYLASEGRKTFTDRTIPRGAWDITYMITATRSTKRGAPAQFNVNFGASGDGMVVAAASGEAGAMKMAA